MATIANAMKEVNLSSTSKTQGGSGSAALNDTDLVQLYDNAGNPNGKITKSALMDAVKASLPAILSDQTTTGVNFPSINGSGVLGKMTAANLASVLGGGVDVPSGANLNDYKTPGVYRWAGGRTNQPTGTYSSVMVVYSIPNTLLWQTLYTKPENYVYIRSYAFNSSTWSSWQRIDNYGTSTAAELATLLGVATTPKGTLTDISAADSLLANGLYWINYTNWWGNLVNIVGTGDGGASRRMQIWYSSNQHEVRVRTYTTSWGNWSRADGFGCNNLSSLASALGANFINYSDTTKYICISLFVHFRGFFSVDAGNVKADLYFISSSFGSSGTDNGMKIKALTPIDVNGPVFYYSSTEKKLYYKQSWGGALATVNSLYSASNFTMSIVDSLPADATTVTVIS